MDNALKILTELTENREKNLKKFEDCETDILKQVNNVKEQMIKQIDKHERTVIKDLSTMRQRNEAKLNEEKADLAELIAQVQEGKEQIEFLKEHGSKNQLFLALKKQENKIKATESRLQKLTSTYKDTKLTFYSGRDSKTKSIFSVVESSTPCTIKHKSLMLQQAQAEIEIESKKKSDCTNNYGSKLTMSTSGMTLETIQDELHDLIVVKAVRNEDIFDWIEANLDHYTTKDNNFIRALMTVVCSSAIKGRGKMATVDPRRVHARDVILQKYFDHQLEFELQTLYALQALVHKLDHPPKVLRTLFDVLYDEDIISEDAFTKWEGNANPTEQEGKEIAMKCVVQFFTWIREANDAPDE
ncbi:EIF4G [Mytilus coruscus]|uniref:EIF4G n=1 Tax=Mytilus coruscus TaxID=42192 RepID=A0A6J8AFQ5_MYTCO|nr:EIF4G [Mytilus coruscus]